MCDTLGSADSWIILKKPFDNVEVRQLACSLSQKWALSQQAQLKARHLQALVEERTSQLERVNHQLKDINDELLSARDRAQAANRAQE